MKDDPVVIVGAARTPMAGFGGEFADITAPELGAAAISGALDNAGVVAGDVEDGIINHEGLRRCSVSRLLQVGGSQRL